MPAGVKTLAEVCSSMVAGGHALEEQAQHREPHVGVDAVGNPVEDRPEADAALELPPGLLDPQQLLVAQGHVLGREGIVVAGDDELPIM
jgi:hypothetical protein